MLLYPGYGGHRRIRVLGRVRLALELPGVDTDVDVADSAARPGATRRGAGRHATRRLHPGRLPTGRIVLVGHSMGGMTILALALKDPELFRDRVAGVGLTATGAGHYIDGHRVENAFRWISRRKLLTLNLVAFRLLAPLLEQIRPRRTRTMRWVTKKVMFGTADIDPATLSMTHELLEEPPLSTHGSLQGSLLRHDVMRAMDPLNTTPVVIITGFDDRLTRPEHSERMAADIGPAAAVAGAGHIVNQTRPVETNAALDRLLTRAKADPSDLD